MDEFAVAFNDADVLIVADIYPASEDPIGGVTSAALVERIKQFGHKNVHYGGDVDMAARRVLEVARPGDLVLTLGAGPVYRAGEKLIDHFKDQRPKTKDQRPETRNRS
jgi:UDP-N-acetylmuramate--alanine ligase